MMLLRKEWNRTDGAEGHPLRRLVQKTAPANPAMISEENNFPSVIIPVFNEEKTINEIVTRVVDLSFRKEIIVVDDGSTDSTSKHLLQWKNTPQVRVLTHASNQGKGSAIRSGIGVATGAYTVIQDADLEYSPEDLHRVLTPLASGNAEIVYGSRYSSPAVQHPHFVSRHGVRLLNRLVWFLYRIRLTDQATCYKAFRSEVLRRMDLQCCKFEFCAEVTAKACRMQIPILEVPIAYEPRGYLDGKKIRTRDGIQCAATLFRYGRWTESDRVSEDPRHTQVIPAVG